MTTTTTTALDQKTFISRVTAFITKREISRYNAASHTSSYRLITVLNDVQRYAKYNEEDGIPAQYAQTAYGIGWAIETGRINGVTHIALKAMSVRELLILINRVHVACNNMGEVPAYLHSLSLSPRTGA